MISEQPDIQDSYIGKILETAINQVKQEKDQYAQAAWILRRAFDEILDTKEEENEFLQAMAYGPEDHGHNDGSGGSIRGFSALCTYMYVSFLVLML